jgi:cytochrome c2
MAQFRVTSSLARLLYPVLVAAVAGIPPAAEAARPDREALVQADYRQGRTAFQQRCSACHTLAEGGSNLVGPNLWGLMSRKAGTAPGYSYSAAMGSAGFQWNVDRLWDFLSGPQQFVPGTTMMIPEPVPEQDRTAMIAFMMLETGAADWPKPAVAMAREPTDREKPLSERFPSFWNHLMTNTTRYKLRSAAGEYRFDAYFNTDGSVTASEKKIRGFWHVDERDFFCYALYNIPATPSQFVECFPVVAMSIPRFAEELWQSKPVEGVVLHGGIVAGRPD